MGHHVVREHHVRRAVLGAYAGRDVSVEELHEGRDAAVLRHLRRAGGGLDAQHIRPVLQEVAQQVTVVARDLDQEPPWSDQPLLGQLVSVLASVPVQRF